MLWTPSDLALTRSGPHHKRARTAARTGLLKHTHIRRDLVDCTDRHFICVEVTDELDTSLTLTHSRVFDRRYLVDTVVMVPIEEAEHHLEQTNNQAI